MASDSSTGNVRPIHQHTTSQGRRWASVSLAVVTGVLIYVFGSYAIKMNAAIEAQRQRVELYMLSDPIAKVACDTSHRIIIANLAAEKMFGYAPNELIGKPVDILIPPERVADHNRAINNATLRIAKMQGDWVVRQSIKTEAMRRDGSRINTLMDIRSIKYGNPPRVEFIASLINADDEIPAREVQQLPTALPPPPGLNSPIQNALPNLGNAKAKK